MGRGGSVVIVCPACGAESPDGFKYCGQCASPLSAPPSIVEERKTVTTLFCDLVAFTAMSEAADPEDVDAVLTEYFARATRAIESHSGTVEKFIGDAVVGVFGVPAVHEDDPERAVRAALRILGALAGMTRPDGSPLQARVGVNTGEALVRLDVDPASGRGFLTGDAVNTAARLEAAAPPGGVVIGPLTRSSIADWFVCEALEPVEAKGKAEPVPAWLVKAAISRTGLRTSGESATAFVGRRREFEVLDEVLKSAQADRSARYVLLVGEPGIGKSRLVLEFAKSLERRPDPFVWRQGRCLAYGEGVTFWPLSEILKAHAGILDSDDVATVESKLEAALPEADDRPWLRQRLRPLLGLEAPQAARRESFVAWTRFLAHIARDHPTVLVIEDAHWADDAMLEFLDHILAQTLEVPLLVLVTARPELLQRVPGTLAVVSAERAAALRVMLAPLSEEDSGTLLASLLDARLALGIADRLVDLVGGNPLFVEQYVRLLLDRGLLVLGPDGLHVESSADLPLPDTVQAVLAARLDSLPAAQKAVLCDAAVIGESFWRGCVADLSGRDLAEMDEVLSGLLARGLLRPVDHSSMAGEVEYIFWHAVVRDVAYAQLPRRLRLEKHRATARWLEDAVGDRADEFAEILAHHYVTALGLATALHLPEEVESLAMLAGGQLIRAGERNRVFDAVASARQLEQALELLPAEAVERPRVLFLRAEALSWRRPEEAVPAFEEAADALRGGDDPNEVASCLTQLAECMITSGQGDWRGPIDEAVGLLDERRPTFELVVALQELACLSLLGSGDAEAAIDFAERSLSAAERLSTLLPVGALGWRGAARCWLGDDRGLEDYEKAIAVGVAQGFGMQLVGLMHNYACCVSPRKGPAAALPLFDEGLQLAKRHDNLQLALSARGAVASCLVDLGEWARAREALAELADLTSGECPAEVTAEIQIERARLLVQLGRADEATALADSLAAMAKEGLIQSESVTRCFAFAAEVYVALGRRDVARHLLEASLPVLGWRETCDVGVVRSALACGDVALAERLAEGFKPLTTQHENVLASAAGLLDEARGDHAAAAVAFADSSARWRDFGVPYEEAQALLGQGRCLLALGRVSEAAAPLNEAREILQQLGARPALDEVRRLLDQLPGPSRQATTR
jgi:class 3 adenylate cyclase/tetratricopeptide (TPR) repeat protein